MPGSAGTTDPVDTPPGVGPTARSVGTVAITRRTASQRNRSLSSGVAVNGHARVQRRGDAVTNIGSTARPVSGWRAGCDEIHRHFRAMTSPVALASTSYDGLSLPARLRSSGLFSYWAAPSSASAARPARRVSGSLDVQPSLQDEHRRRTSIGAVNPRLLARDSSHRTLGPSG